MNLDDKLKMAHEYVMKNSEGTSYIDFDVKLGWKYADEMEKQHNERKRIEDEKSNKEVLKIINNHQNAYMNCEIQVTDGNGDCRITTRQKEQERKEWQPDWSIALKSMIYFAVDCNGDGYFYEYKPYISEGYDYWGDVESKYEGLSAEEWDDHDYQGDWKDSLRERLK